VWEDEGNERESAALKGQEGGLLDMAELAFHTWCPVTSRDSSPRPLTIAAEVPMSKIITVKKAPKSTKSMTEAVKAIRVESGIKAGKESSFKGPIVPALRGG
jgi:hypothetical protein